MILNNANLPSYIKWISELAVLTTLSFSPRLTSLVLKIFAFKSAPQILKNSEEIKSVFGEFLSQQSLY